MMTNSARRGRRISYLGESALGENTVIWVSIKMNDGQLQAGEKSRGSDCISSRRRGRERGDGTHINKHVFPQAPSPTMTSFRRSSAILEDVIDVGWGG